MQEGAEKMPADGGPAEKNRLPPQVVRVILLTVFIMASYFVARHFLVPASFGQYGWYRGNALQELRVLPISYAGRAACVECHSDEAEKMSRSSHRSVSCESCHGPNHTHAEDPTESPSKIEDPRFCLRCHQAVFSRPAKFPQIEAAAHYSAQRCKECHPPHAPTDIPTK